MYEGKAGWERCTLVFLVRDRLAASMQRRLGPGPKICIALETASFGEEKYKKCLVVEATRRNMEQPPLAWR
jgi:hypothetical protein